MSEDFAAPTPGSSVPPGYGPGSRIAGYVIEEQIGRGGMAVVFRARDERLSRQVALKILSPAMASDEGFRQRFIGESRKAAAVDDPHIIPVHEAGEADGVLFIAMRYVPGSDVRSLVRSHGPLPPARAAAIISPVASALDAAHASGLVHRDVKPANMLIDVRPGRPDHVYLSDFGLSKHSLSSVGLTRSGQFLGTLDYSAPEQIEGKQVDGRADQYSLACAAFELLTGAPPFLHDQIAALMWAHMSEQPPRLTSRRPDLPPRADAVFARALAKSSAERYGSCREFADALRYAFGLVPYDSDPGTVPPVSHPRTQLADLGPGPVTPPPASPELATKAVHDATRPRQPHTTPPVPAQPTPHTVPPAGGWPASPPQPRPVAAQPLRPEIAVAGSVLLLAASVAGIAGASFPGPISTGSKLFIAFYLALAVVTGIAMAGRKQLTQAMLVGLWAPAGGFLVADAIAVTAEHSFYYSGSGLVAYYISDLSDVLAVAGFALMAAYLLPKLPRHRLPSLSGLPGILLGAVGLCGLAEVALFATYPYDTVVFVADGLTGLLIGIVLTWYALGLGNRSLAVTMVLCWTVSTLVFVFLDNLTGWSNLTGAQRAWVGLGTAMAVVVIVLAINFLRLPQPGSQGAAPQGSARAHR